MRCPRDRTPLMATPFLGLTMESCPNCDGTFLDAGELSRIHGLEDHLVRGDGLEAQDPQGGIACPQCAGTMETRWFSPARRTMIDCCGTCGGLWLDTSELKAILAEAYSSQHP